MFSNSPLYALSKIQNKIDIFKIQVGKDAIEPIRANFIKGITCFDDLEMHYFSPGYKLDPGECAQINNFIIPDILLDAIRNSANLSVITGSQFKEKHIKALFMGEMIEQNDDEKYIIVFKRFYLSSFLSHNMLNLIFSKDTYSALNTEVIAIPETWNAVFKDGNLTFSSYKIANEMLDLTDRYRSATSKDIDKFEKFISYDTTKIKLSDFANTRARKLIAMINDSDVLKLPKEELIDAAKDQNINLNYGQNGLLQLNFDNKKETMLILDFLAENTFISTFTKERNRTNSKEKC